jgi:TRAP-type C4-dicarboxylate transport system permease small subunit
MVATAVLFSVMVLAAVWQVFSREVLQSPSAFTEELAKYTFVWTSLIAAALVFGERGHIAVTFVVERMPRAARKVVAVFVQLVILLFAVVVMIVGGVYAAQNTWMQQLTALPGTIGMAYLVLPISGVFITFYAIYHLLEDLRGEGPLTTPVAEVEEEVPEIPGLDQIVDDPEGFTREARSGRGDDDVDGPAAADPKEK